MLIKTFFDDENKESKVVMKIFWVEVFFGGGKRKCRVLR